MARIYSSTASRRFSHSSPRLRSVLAFITRSASGKTMRSSLSKCSRERRHRPQQQLARLLRAPRLLHLRQPGVNFVMLLVKRLALPDLRQAMLQRFHQQFVLGPGVCAHERLQRGRQQFDLRQRLEAWHGLLDVIEQIVEHHVFRHQNFRDFHGSNRTLSVCILKSPHRLDRTSLFLAFFLPDAAAHPRPPEPTHHSRLKKNQTKQLNG